MNLVALALKRPITIIVIVISLLIFSIFAFFSISIDIFPKLNLPAIYVIESYGGMSPQQMEGFFSTGLQDQFLYINGIKNIESKNIQGLTLLKLTFYENTDMGEASAQVALQVNRAMRFFPPGALPPQVIRFDASSLPVGQLVLSSTDKSLKDIYDLATTRIRPVFSAINGLSAPPAMGSNARTVLIDVNPNKIRSYGISPDEMIYALAKSNVMAPSGYMRVGNTMFVTTMNSLEKTVKEFSDIPVAFKNGQMIFVRDFATVSDGADMTVDYALINGKRSVYLPVVKTADASTWEVVQSLKKKIPEMQSLLPDDVKILYEFDQSVFVINAVKSLATEGILGALLTGLMVLLFLRDFRSSLIVIITIPVSILSALLLLRLFGQTVNLMTLSGLSLAVGILVDESTVTIENIHQHLVMNKTKARAIYDACMEIYFAKILILLCILSVFAPSFLMSGVPKAMFLPLSLSIAFAMLSSFFLAQTFVPILANWILKDHQFSSKHGKHNVHAGEALDKEERQQIEDHLKEEKKRPSQNDFFQRLKIRFMYTLRQMHKRKALIITVYLSGVITLTAICFLFIGKDLLPKTNTGEFQIRIKAPVGTRLERTEDKLKQVISIIDSTVQHQVEITSAFVGIVPSSFGVSNLYVFNSGTHEAVLQVSLNPKAHYIMDDLKDIIRKNIKNCIPDLQISFEPIDLTEKIMGQGAFAPIEIQVAGKNFDDIKNWSGKLLKKLKNLPYLRDIQIQQPLEVPTIEIKLDRFKIALFGLTVSEVSNSVTASTTSSRFVDKNLWLDENVAYTYQVQVQVPEYRMTDLDELKEIPLIRGKDRPVLADVADFTVTTSPGEFDRTGPRRFVTVSANLYKKDLASASRDIQKIINSLGTPPKGLVIGLTGMSGLLVETLGSLQTGLAFAVLVILMLLSANYESFKLGLTVLTTVPAVLLGSLSILLICGDTLNLESYMGIIMSIGVSVANAILIVTNAEQLRIKYKSAEKAAITAAGLRLRPILMTSFAMIAGMIPMASGIGEAGEQTAPLGRAVIGGLAASIFAALFILPLIFTWAQKNTGFKDNSLMPKEPGIAV